PAQSLLRRSRPVAVPSFQSSYPIGPVLSDWARWVFVTGADTDRGAVGQVRRRFRPWLRHRPSSHSLWPPEPLAHERRDRRRHEGTDDQRVEQQAETDG